VTPETTIEVINTPCLVTNAADLTGRIEDRVRHHSESPWSIDFTNVHIVAMRKVDEGFREQTSSVDWFVPDSQILTWAVSWLGARGNYFECGSMVLPFLTTLFVMPMQA
jgi:UDP-N-acetyl-D-mannosaminuronic acid transferase (WecB/TagA/CpsF family)